MSIFDRGKEKLKKLQNQTPVQKPASSPAKSTGTTFVNRTQQRYGNTGSGSGSGTAQRQTYNSSTARNTWKPIVQKAAPIVASVFKSAYRNAYENDRQAYQSYYRPNNPSSGSHIISTFMDAIVTKPVDGAQRPSAASGYNYESVPQNQWRAPQMVAYARKTGDNALLEQMSSIVDTPGDPAFNPYLGGRNTIPQEGLDYLAPYSSEGQVYDQKWYDDNISLKYYLRYSDTGSVLQPKRTSSSMEHAAWWHNRVGMYLKENDQLNEQYAQYRQDFGKFVDDYTKAFGRAPTLEECMERVPISNYSKLAAFDESYGQEKTVQFLPKGTYYSSDIIPGLYYSAINGGDLSEDRDYFEDTVSYWENPSVVSPSTMQYDWGGKDLSKVSEDDLNRSLAALAAEGDMEQYMALYKSYRDAQPRDASVPPSTSIVDKIGGFYHDDAWFNKMLEQYEAAIDIYGGKGKVKSVKKGDPLEHEIAYELDQQLKLRDYTDTLETEWTDAVQAIIDYADDNRDVIDFETFSEEVMDAIDLEHKDKLEAYLNATDYTRKDTCRPVFASKENLQRIMKMAYDGQNVSPMMDYTQEADYSSLSTDSPATPSPTYEADQAQAALDREAQRDQEEAAVTDAVVNLSNSNVPITKGQLEAVPPSMDMPEDGNFRGMLAYIWASNKKADYDEQLGEGYTVEDMAASDPVLAQLDTDDMPDGVTVNDLVNLNNSLSLSRAKEEAVTLATGIVNAALPGIRALGEVVDDLFDRFEFNMAYNLAQRPIDTVAYKTTYEKLLDQGYGEKGAARVAFYAAVEIPESTERVAADYEGVGELVDAAKNLFSEITKEPGALATFSVITDMNERALDFFGMGRANDEPQNDFFGMPRTRDVQAPNKRAYYKTGTDPFGMPRAVDEHQPDTFGMERVDDEPVNLSELNTALIIGSSSAADPGYQNQTNQFLYGFMNGEISPDDIVTGIKFRDRMRKAEMAAQAPVERPELNVAVEGVQLFGGKVVSPEEYRDLVLGEATDIDNDLFFDSSRISPELKEAIDYDGLMAQANEDVSGESLVRSAIHFLVHRDDAYHTSPLMLNYGTNVSDAIAEYSSGRTQEDIDANLKARGPQNVLNNGGLYGAGLAIGALFGVKQTPESRLYNELQTYGKYFAVEEVDQICEAVATGQITPDEGRSIIHKRVGSVSEAAVNWLNNPDAANRADERLDAGLSALYDRVANMPSTVKLGRMLDSDMSIDDLMATVGQAENENIVVDEKLAAEIPYDLEAMRENFTNENGEFDDAGFREALKQITGAVPENDYLYFNGKQLKGIGKLVELRKQLGSEGYLIDGVNADGLEALSSIKLSDYDLGDYVPGELMNIIDPNWREPYTLNPGATFGQAAADAASKAVRDVLSVPSTLGYLLGEMVNGSAAALGADLNFHPFRQQKEAFDELKAASEERRHVVDTKTQQFFVPAVSEVGRIMINGAVGGAVADAVGSTLARALTNGITGDTTLAYNIVSALGDTGKAVESAITLAGRLPMAVGVFSNTTAEELEASGDMLKATTKGLLGAGIEVGTESLPLEKMMSFGDKAGTILDHAYHTIDDYSFGVLSFIGNTAKNVASEIGEDEVSEILGRLVDFGSNLADGKKLGESWGEAWANIGPAMKETAIATAWTTLLLGVVDMGGMTANIVMNAAENGNDIDAQTLAEAIEIDSLASFFGEDEDDDYGYAEQGDETGTVPESEPKSEAIDYDALSKDAIINESRRSARERAQSNRNAQNIDEIESSVEANAAAQDEAMPRKDRRKMRNNANLMNVDAMLQEYVNEAVKNPTEENLQKVAEEAKKVTEAKKERKRPRQAVAQETDEGTLQKHPSGEYGNRYWRLGGNQDFENMLNGRARPRQAVAQEVEPTVDDVKSEYHDLTPGAQATVKYLDGAQEAQDKAVVNKHADQEAQKAVEADPGLKSQADAIEKQESTLKQIDDEINEKTRNVRFMRRQLAQTFDAAFMEGIAPEIPSPNVDNARQAKTEQISREQAETTELQKKAKKLDEDINKSREKYRDGYNEVYRAAKEQAKNKAENDVRALREQAQLDLEALEYGGKVSQGGEEFGEERIRNFQELNKPNSGEQTKQLIGSVEARQRERQASQNLQSATDEYYSQVTSPGTSSSTEAETARLEQARTEFEEAKQELETFETNHGLNPRGTVEAARTSRGKQEYLESRSRSTADSIEALQGRIEDLKAQLNLDTAAINQELREILSKRDEAQKGMSDEDPDKRREATQTYRNFKKEFDAIAERAYKAKNIPKKQIESELARLEAELEQAQKNSETLQGISEQSANNDVSAQRQRLVDDVAEKQRRVDELEALVNGVDRPDINDAIAPTKNGRRTDNTGITEVDPEAWRENSESDEERGAREEDRAIRERTEQLEAYRVSESKKGAAGYPVSDDVYERVVDAMEKKGVYSPSMAYTEYDIDRDVQKADSQTARDVSGEAAETSDEYEGDSTEMYRGPAKNVRKTTDMSDFMDEEGNVSSELASSFDQSLTEDHPEYALDNETRGVYHKYAENDQYIVVVRNQPGSNYSEDQKKYEALTKPRVGTEYVNGVEYENDGKTGLERGEEAVAKAQKDYDNYNARYIEAIGRYEEWKAGLEAQIAEARQNGDKEKVKKLAKQIRDEDIWIKRTAPASLQRMAEDLFRLKSDLKAKRDFVKSYASRKYARRQYLVISKGAALNDFLMNLGSDPDTINNTAAKFTADKVMGGIPEDANLQDLYVAALMPQYKQADPKQNKLIEGYLRKEASMMSPEDLQIEIYNATRSAAHQALVKDTLNAITQVITGKSEIDRFVAQNGLVVNSKPRKPGAKYISLEAAFKYLSDEERAKLGIKSSIEDYNEDVYANATRYARENGFDDEQTKSLIKGLQIDAIKSGGKPHYVVDSDEGGSLLIAEDRRNNSEVNTYIRKNRKVGGDYSVAQARYVLKNKMMNIINIADGRVKTKDGKTMEVRPDIDNIVIKYFDDLGVVHTRRYGDFYEDAGGDVTRWLPDPDDIINTAAEITCNFSAQFGDKIHESRVYFKLMPNDIAKEAGRDTDIAAVNDDDLGYLQTSQEMRDQLKFIQDMLSNPSIPEEARRRFLHEAYMIMYNQSKKAYKDFLEKTTKASPDTIKAYAGLAQTAYDEMVAWGAKITRPRAETSTSSSIGFVPIAIQGETAEDQIANLNVQLLNILDGKAYTGKYRDKAIKQIQDYMRFIQKTGKPIGVFPNRAEPEYKSEAKPMTFDTASKQLAEAKERLDELQRSVYEDEGDGIFSVERTLLSEYLIPYYEELAAQENPESNAYVVGSGRMRQLIDKYNNNTGLSTTPEDYYTDLRVLKEAVDAGYKLSDIRSKAIAAYHNARMAGMNEIERSDYLYNLAKLARTNPDSYIVDPNADYGKALEDSKRNEMETMTKKQKRRISAIRSMAGNYKTSTGAKNALAELEAIIAATGKDEPELREKLQSNIDRFDNPQKAISDATIDAMIPETTAQETVQESVEPIKESIESNDSSNDSQAETVENEQNAETITSFRGDYSFLSNFADASFTWDGRTYRNSEAAFQSAKSNDPAVRDTFSSMNGKQAKRAGRNVQLRGDWNSVRLSVMEDIVRAKFTQNPDLAAKLVATGNADLTEGNTWGDTFWGVNASTGKGENNLGKILMKIRDELKQKPTQKTAKKAPKQFLKDAANTDTASTLESIDAETKPFTMNLQLHSDDDNVNDAQRDEQLTEMLEEMSRPAEIVTGNERAIEEINSGKSYIRDENDAENANLLIAQHSAAIKDLTEEIDSLKNKIEILESQNQAISENIGNVTDPAAKAQLIATMNANKATIRKHQRQIDEDIADRKSRKRLREQLGNNIIGSDLALMHFTNRAAIHKDSFTSKDKFTDARADAYTSQENVLKELKAENVVSGLNVYTTEQLGKAISKGLEGGKQLSIDRETAKFLRQHVREAQVQLAFLNLGKAIITGEDMEVAGERAYEELMKLYPERSYTDKALEQHLRKQQAVRKAISEYIKKFPMEHDLTTETEGLFMKMQLDIDVLSAAVARGEEIYKNLYKNSTERVEDLFVNGIQGRLPAAVNRMTWAIMRNNIRESKIRKLLKKGPAWNPIRAVAENLDTFPRYVRDLFNNDAADYFTSMYIAPVREGERKAIQHAEEYHKMYDWMRSLNKETKEAITYVVDYGMDDDIVRRNYPDIADDVIKGAETARKIFRELNEMINVVYARNGIELLKRRENYVPHIKDEPNTFLRTMGIYTSFDDVPTAMLGRASDYHPLHEFFRFAYERNKDDMDGCIKDISKLLDLYIPSALKQVYQTDNIVRLEDLIQTIDESGDYTDLGNGAPGGLSIARATIEKYMQAVAGKKVGYIDRAVETSVGRKFYSWAKVLTAVKGQSATAANLNVVAANFEPLTMCMGMNPACTIRAITDTISSMTRGEADPMLNRSNFYIARNTERGRAENSYQKLVNKLHVPAEMSDAFVSQVVTRACQYMIADKMGIDRVGYSNLHRQMILTADNLATSIMASRGRGEKVQVLNSSMGAIVGQFLLEPINNIMFMMKDLPKYARAGKKGKELSAFNGAVKALATLLVAFSGHELINQLVGRQVVAEPISDIYTAIRDRKETDTAGDVALSMADKLIDDLNPFNNLIANNKFSGHQFQIPVIGGIPIVGGVESTINEIIEAAEHISNAIDAKNNGTEYNPTETDFVSDLMGIWAQIMPGGVQTKRIYDTAVMAKRGYALSEGKGRLKYTFNPTPLNVGLSAAFGPNSSLEGREYVKSGYNTSSDKKTKQFLDYVNMGYDPIAVKEWQDSDTANNVLEKEISKDKTAGKDVREKQNQAQEIRSNVERPGDMLTLSKEEGEQPYVANAISAWQKYGIDAYPRLALSEDQQKQLGPNLQSYIDEYTRLYRSAAKKYGEDMSKADAEALRTRSNQITSKLKKKYLGGD